MASADFQEASEQFKDEIITQFLKANPGVKRSEVTLRYVNGKVVCEHISNTFADLSKRKIRSKEEQQLLNELASGGDKRYSICLESISSSRQFSDWLVDSPGIAYDEMDRGETNRFLERREQLSANYALELNGFKKKIAKLMESEEETPEEQVKLLMTEYFQSSHAQLKCQKSVMEKECELGDMFTDYSEEFIKEHYLELKPKAGPKTVDAIKQAYNILRSSIIDMEEVDAKEKITSKAQLKKLAGGLNKLNNQLNTKRQQLEAIQKMIAFLEELVATMKQEQHKKPPPKPKAKSGSTNEPEKRMAFLARAKKLITRG